MKTILIVSSAVLLLADVQLRADLALQSHDVVAICGDSITENKRYSAFMEDYFLMCKPVEDLRSVQFGWSGETVEGFLARIDSDVLPFKPTVATTCYGMNDGGYAPMSQKTGDAFREAITASVDKLKGSGVRAIIVGSPGCVDPATFAHSGITADEYNKTLGALKGIAQEVSQKEGVGFADVHTVMMDVMAKWKAAYGEKCPFIPGDGIHPGNSGDLVMAYAFLKALGCDGAIGTITVDLEKGEAEATPGQKVISCQHGTVEVESRRYPFCFQGSADKPEQTTASVLNFFPFNSDLNRYVLVVKGVKGSKAKVTWGTTTKEFSVSDLAKGVNLAAEFLVNPFSHQFTKVQAAVQAQQDQETILVKTFLHSLSSFKAIAPNSSQELDKVAVDGIAREKSLSDAAIALVVPIRHTITIESEP